MNGNPPADQKETQASILEVVNNEQLLWATIQHKGILHAEVRDLYRKTSLNYEKIILNDYQTVNLQEIEYSLWKLNYKIIDEYRKKIKKVSTAAETTNNLSSHIEGFKLFLFEVAEFYKDLTARFREKTFFLQKNQYTCHRFLVCLGDISRYIELCKKPDCQTWSVAATYYLEASTVWPRSGNPHNQLALLATYIGDDFLALYHCIRSLAVKEPFPDARDNIMLLFEKNKSSQLRSLSTDAHIDFSKPLKRLSSQISSHSSMDSSNVNKLGANENVTLAKANLWPLFVRMISFFLVTSRVEDLPHTFASTMKELEALLAVNDAELNSLLEAYEPFDSSRKGPYRALQAITMLIFVIHHLIKTTKLQELNEKNDKELFECITWAWTCTFSCLGHLLQRCLGFTEKNHGNHCPLLPSVLVFVEWYVGMIDYAETCSKDEKVSNAKSYFFTALVDFLSGFDVNEHNSVNSANQTALWEDHELRGFEPVTQSHDPLDFSTHSENKTTFEHGNSLRVNRIFRASIEIANRSSENLFLYDQSTSKFSKKTETEIKPSGVEDEEVILFKPLTRFNSEPINQTESSEDILRRSSSLLSEQKDLHGPPSLSGWVLNSESLNLERKREPRTSPNTRELAPISEIPTSFLANMSIAESEPEPYVAPIPSAPFLPEENGILGPGPPPVSSGVAGFVDAYHPPVYGLTSSEWLYRYHNNLSLEVPGNDAARSVHGYEGGARFDLVDKWGNPLLTNRTVYFENPNQRFGYQRAEQQASTLQPESPFRGYPYMRN